MRFLLCGTLVPAEYEVEIREISNAANRFLTNLCSQLEVHNSLKILSYIGIAIDDKTKTELNTEEKQNIQYVFKSRRILGGVMQMLRAAWKELKYCDYAVTYNVVYAWMLTPVLAKLRKKKSVLILADYSPAESHESKKQQLYAKIQEYFIGQYDYVIGLSEKTKKYLRPAQKFMCMEGGISEEVFRKFEKQSVLKNDKVTMMYSGILEKVTGIDLLVEAFRSLERDDIQLVITGDGSLADWLCEITGQCANIHYLGCIPYENYIQKLSEADVLINPRNMSLPENANNFPSKIMEFLATGKQIISTKFPGWERYQEYIEFCDSDCESLGTAINNCASNAGEWTEENYQRNREFAKSFLWVSQVESIMKFLEQEN